MSEHDPEMVPLNAEELDVGELDEMALDQAAGGSCSLLCVVLYTPADP